MGKCVSLHMAKKKPPFLRYLESINVCSETNCWFWTGATYKNGYGWIKVFGKNVSAHRFSYELHNGKISDGMCILHSCDNKNCVNPDHLRQGTHKENMREAAERGRMRSGENHPMYGKKNPRPRQAKKVFVLGKEYSSQNDAEKKLGLGSGTVRYWILNKPNKARIIKED